MASPGVVDWDNVVELGGAIATGGVERPEQDNITVFKSLGIGLADVALGALVTRRLMEKSGAETR